jgi:GNAT superfamily N-acetyltransferase
MELTVRSTRTEDAQAWHALWRGYCAALDGAVSDKVTEGVWQRILASNEPVWCLLACRAGNEPVGFANYVLHPHTWSLQPVCYLEDLFVAPEARSSGAGRALIEGIVALGRRHGWRSVYWRTHEDNHRARTLYDRLAPRTDYVRYDIDL